MKDEWSTQRKMKDEYGLSCVSARLKEKEEWRGLRQ
jgi:hypothetical protein